jgi:hypothetical protein
VIDFGEWSPNPTHEFTVLTIDTKKEEEKRAQFSAQTNKRKQSRNSSDLRISAIAGIPLSSPPPLMASPSDPTNP